MKNYDPRYYIEIVAHHPKHGEPFIVIARKEDGAFVRLPRELENFTPASNVCELLADGFTLEVQPEQPGVRPLKTRGDLVRYLSKMARQYAQGGIEESVRRNSHMNQVMSGIEFNRISAEAAIVDFVNYVAASQCIYLGLYASDLRKAGA